MTNESSGQNRLTSADVMTLDDVAELIGKSRWTVRRMVDRGELPARRFAGGLLFIRDQVEAALRGELGPGPGFVPLQGS